MKIVEIQNPPSVETLIERFGRRRLSFVLDSAQTNDGLGEWSFFGAEPFQVVGGDLADLRRAMKPYVIQSYPGIPFTGGAVGYLSYDYGRRLETFTARAADDRSIPDMHFGLYDGVVALNHQTGILYLIAHDFVSPAESVIERLRIIVGASLDEAPTIEIAKPARRSEWTWNLTKEDFCTAVQRVRDYISSGDVYQVNLSQRARCRYEGDSVQLYQALRRGNPAPYGAYLELGDWQLISTSPEQFLQKRGRSLETRPIKGTRPRGIDAAADLQNAEALRTSEKDRAELLMIVDLERNDLGRVAEFGSVHVEGLYHLERYARVIHQTARVKATLAKDKDVYDALAALFRAARLRALPKSAPWR